MLTLALSAAVAMVAAGMLLNIARLLRGPEAVDRILALDTLSINAIALVMLLGMLLTGTVYFEIALLIAMTGFVATAALCRYLLGGGVID
jgi:multicomponent K+:H+ antiporter subunit F